MKKSIFITPSNLTKEVLDYSKIIDSQIISIDGEKLAELTTENNIGNSLISKYEVKKIDSGSITST